MGMDLTQDEFRAQYLTLKTADGVDRTDAYLGRHYYSGAELPSEVDWSTWGAVTAIKNQGSCGSCWAFSTTGSLEGRTQIAQGTLPTLSEQQFVDCDTDFGDQGCNGGLMDNASSMLCSLVVCAQRAATATQGKEDPVQP